MLDLDGSDSSSSGIKTLFTVTKDEINNTIMFSNFSNDICFIYDFRHIYKADEEIVKRNFYNIIPEIDYALEILLGNYVVLIPDIEYSIQSITDMISQEKAAIDFNDIIYIANIQQIVLNNLNDENSICGVGLLNNGNIIIFMLSNEIGGLTPGTDIDPGIST